MLGSTANVLGNFSTPVRKLRPEVSNVCIEMAGIERCVRITFSEYSISALAITPRIRSLSWESGSQEDFAISSSLHFTNLEHVTDIDSEHTEIARSNGCVFYFSGRSLPTPRCLGTGQGSLSSFIHGLFLWVPRSESGFRCLSLPWPRISIVDPEPSACRSQLLPMRIADISIANGKEGGKAQGWEIVVLVSIA